MNPFKAAARVVTAPIRAVRKTRDLLRARNEALKEWDIAAEAEADPRLYRDPTWWSRLLIQAGELVAVLPIAKEARVTFQDVMIKATMVVGAIGGLAGYLSDAGILQMLPPKYAATIGIVSGAAGTLAALLHKSPLVPKAEAVAEPTK